jgi:hypothetical protein
MVFCFHYFSPSSTETTSTVAMNECFFHDDDYYFDENEEETSIYNSIAASQELHRIEFSSPPTDDWIDAPASNPSLFPTIITIDEAKSQQWEMTKDEIKHVRFRLKKLLNKEEIDNNDIIDHFLGPKSKFAFFLTDCLKMDMEIYVVS